VIAMSNACLSSFAGAVAATICRSTDARLVPVEVKRLLANALRDTRFVLDCADAATSAIVSSVQSSTWDNPPIVDDDESQFSVRLIYWPAGSRNSPHRHTFWTVTGVLSNELSFRTYAEPSADGAPLVRQREFRGRAGDVGIIVPPCIHEVSNPSRTPSISVHVFSGPKVLGVEANRYERGSTTWFDEKGNFDDGAERTASDIFGALIALLDTVADPRAAGILERLFAVADISAKLACTKAIARLDPSLAVELLRKVADECIGEDRPRLHAIADRLRASLC
jgi:predicted metal-dependent enzyme (double-stranded beta helix superfamily)